MTFEADLELLLATGRWLGKRGYGLVKDFERGSMDSGDWEVADPNVSIRIWADRGQWFVDLRPRRDGAEWSSLEPWSVCLGVPTRFHDPRPTDWDEPWLALANSWHLRPQVDFLQAHISQIEDACHPLRLEAITQCIAEAERLSRHGLT